jgi:Family of unknown function (DUF6152)
MPKRRCFRLRPGDGASRCGLGTPLVRSRIREQPVCHSERHFDQIEWTNPHGWVYIDVRGDDGKVTNWAVEFGSPNALLRRGVRRTDFPIGISLVIKGYRAKSGLPVINGSSVKFPDGRDLYMGSSNPNAPGAEK